MTAATRAAGLVAQRVPTRVRAHLASPEAILEAIRAWEARYGEPPGMADWAPTRARQSGQDWRIARFYEGDWPSIAAVRKHFGTLNKAIEAAGLIPRAQGQRSFTGRGRRDEIPAPSTPADRHRQLLTLRVRAVSKATGGGDPRSLVDALNDLAASALAWADEVRANDGAGAL